MSDAPAPTATPAAEPAAQPEAANDNAAKTPSAEAASQAAKTLREVRDARRAALAKGGSDPKASSAPAASSPSADTKEKPADSDGAPRDAPKATPGSESGSTSSDAELAALIAEDRRIKAAAKTLEAEKAALAAERKEYDGDIGIVRAARAALAKGDKIGALRAIFPREDLTSDLFWDLAKSVGGDDDERPTIDPDDLAEKAAAKLEAKRLAAEEEAAKKKAEEEAAEKAAEKKDLDEARGLYLGECDRVFQANPAKFPGMARLEKQIGAKLAGKAIGERIIEKFTEYGRTNPGKYLSVAGAMAAVEADLAPEAPAEPQRQPFTTVTNGWRSDPGRPAPADSAPKTLDEIREARRAALRANGTR